MTSKPKPDQEAKQHTQLDRFAEMARKLGANEDETAFKAKLGVIARQRPKEEAAPKKNGKREG